MDIARGKGDLVRYLSLTFSLAMKSGKVGTVNMCKTHNGQVILRFQLQTASILNIGPLETLDCQDES
jgi:hypothetical protein